MEGSLPVHKIQCQWAIKNRKRREVGNNTTMPLENISRVISIQRYSFLWVSNAPKSDKKFLSTLNNFYKGYAQEYYRGIYAKHGEGMSIALALSIAFDTRKKPAIIQMERNNNKIMINVCFIEPSTIDLFWLGRELNIPVYSTHDDPFNENRFALAQPHQNFTVDPLEFKCEQQILENSFEIQDSEKPPNVCVVDLNNIESNHRQPDTTDCQFTENDNSFADCLYDSYIQPY